MKSFVSPPYLAIVTILSLAAFTIAPANAQTFTVLHSFQGSPFDGAIPGGPVLLDSADNIYGATQEGGNFGVGTLFKIDSSGIETVLYHFDGSQPAGTFPLGTIVRYQGNLYGTNLEGGSTDCNGAGCGTVFEFSQGRVKALHTFTKVEGLFPEGLISDSSGNFFGATGNGGPGLPPYCSDELGCGAIFEFSQGKESALYSFGGMPADAQYPNGELLMDSAGNIYGTTQYGGAFGHGTVFELSKNADGTRSEKVLYSFRGTTDGGRPMGGVIMDAKGDLFGTAAYGGPTNPCGERHCGVVFKMARNTDGSWTQRALYRFGGYTGDGRGPVGQLVRDLHGNLYGVTNVGGSNNLGTVFKVDPAGNEMILHSFENGTGDGAYPDAALTMDRSGNLYGVTHNGGTSNAGTVFKIAP